MTLSELTKALKSVDAQTPLVFATSRTKIGKGYHVTELKALSITSIDCAGRTSEWREAALQLMDGSAGDYMNVGKFVGILESSMRKIDGLGDAPAHVEFSPENAGLQRFEIEIEEPGRDHVTIRLSAAQATCKPAFAWMSRPKDSTRKGCCA